MMLVVGTSVGDLVRVREVGAELHRRLGRASLPMPLRLAAAEGLPMAPGIESVSLEDRALYKPVADPREQGVWIAHALAASLMLRRGIRYTDERAWALVVELLVPDWVWSWGSLDVVVASHQAAPLWLLGICHAARAA